HAPTRTLLLTIGILALAWIALLPRLRVGYLALFRRNLESGELGLDFDLPPPDVESLEAMMLALNSSRDAEVLTALDLFEQQGKTKLVPSLILFHPSKAVVTRALDLLEADGRKDLTPILTRLHTHPEPKVRAAAVRVLASLDAPNELVEQFLDDEELRVRATAAIALARRGVLDDTKLEALAGDDDPKEQHALRTSLLRAIRRQPDPRFIPMVHKFSDTKDRGVMVELARAMGALHDPKFIPALISFLAFGDPREPARQALLRYGEAAVNELVRTMLDPDAPYAVRKQIPRTLAGLEPNLAAPPLLDQLPKEKDFVLARNLLRSLAHLQSRRPSAVRRPRLYAKLLRDRFLMLHHYRAWHASLELDSEAHPDHQTSARELLSGLLHEKEQILEEHVFILVALIDEKEDYDAILHGLRDSNQKSRAASLELLENVVPAAVRDEVLAIALGAHPSRPPSVK
ncbi:MAG: HEAT repeat domain-containing protein, partial [Polyangiaceae bacterium]